MGAQLAILDVGVTVGSQQLRMGPYASVGLIGAGAGLRAVITPFETRRGHLRGIEARVGQDVAWEARGSPALRMACEAGRRGVGWHPGGRDGPDGVVPGAHPGWRRRPHAAPHGLDDGGAFVGGDTLRIGPIATVGVWALGGGLRAVVSAGPGQQGTRHGLELRALAMVPSAPAAEAMVLYHLGLDPRGSRGGHHGRAGGTESAAPTAPSAGRHRR